MEILIFCFAARESPVSLEFHFPKWYDDAIRCEMALPFLHHSIKRNKQVN